MSKQLKAKLKELFRRDPWLLVKFVAVTLALGCVGKAIFIGAVVAGDLNPVFAQFVPTLPMVGLTFLAHRYIWGHRGTSWRSHVGGRWSKSYGGQFLGGHGAFIVFYGLLGWQYLAVSLGIGATSAVVTFTLNEWKVFTNGGEKTETAMA